MSKEAIIFEVSGHSFEKYVIGNSDKAPVFVVFMGMWSGPCNQMSDMLSNLAMEFPEQFILAKVDIEENEQLKNQYDIVNIPTLKVFSAAKVVITEEGLLTEEEARALLKRFNIVNHADEIRIEAREKHLSGDTSQAIILLSQAIKQDPSNTRIAMDMVQIFIDIGELEQAKGLFGRLPEKDRTSETGVSLSGQLWIIEKAVETQGLDVLNKALIANPNDYDILFDCAICEIAEHNYIQALDHLFTIQSENANYKDGAAREMIVTIINTISPNNSELAQEYRAKLASILSA